MKTARMILAVLILALGMTGCGSGVYNDNPPAQGEVVIKGDKGDIFAMPPASIIEKFDNGDTFVLYAGTSDCDSCKEYKVTLQKLIDNYEIRIYFVPTPGEADDEYTNNLINNYLYKLVWMPTTYIVVDGHAVSIKEKTVEYADLVDWLSGYGFI